MSGHLLLVALGPVQDFIAQARRTRDLWYGSHLLSELSRCAARALLDERASLIFPALERGHPELEACLAPLRPDTGKPPLSIANKLMAEIPSGGRPPAEVAGAVREAVKQFWSKEVAAPVKSKCAGLIAHGTNDVWEEQIDTLLEFNAAWAPLDSYGKARSQVEAALAARKNLRDFSRWEKSRTGAPKSSLDGARETVLRERDQRDPGQVKRYRIVGDEQLDAVGLVKRAGGKPEQFVPVVNVALAVWLHTATKSLPDLLDSVRQECGRKDIPRVVRDDLPAAKTFPFDATVMFPQRWSALFKERGIGDAAAAQAWGQTLIRPLLKRMMSVPSPYVACLAADGDHMGKAIDALASAADSPAGRHRDFSKALAGFATEARHIVEQDHWGSLIYAGGDDVLAFLPLAKALACAKALRTKFAETMAAACASLPEKERPTLSVGLGVGHVMESMGDLLELGRKAERLAKVGEPASENRDRNAIAVIVDKRSGGQRAWRARWDDWGNDPVGRLASDVKALAEQLSTRKVYEIQQTLRRLPAPPVEDQDTWRRILALEVRRSLSRAHAAEADIDPAGLGLRLDEQSSYVRLREEIGSWVDRMLVARAFAEAEPKVRQPEEGTAT